MALEDILQQIPGAPGATKTGAPSFGAANSLPVQAGADFGLSSFLPTQAGTGMFDTDTDTDNKDTGIPTVLGDKVDMDTALKAYGISGSTLEKADKDAMDAKMAELAELRKIQERNVKDRQRFIDQMQELRGQRPKAPQMQDIPGAPQSKFRNPFEAF